MRMQMPKRSSPDSTFFNPVLHGTVASTAQMTWLRTVQSFTAPGGRCHCLQPQPEATASNHKMRAVVLLL
jgi:hypothetical protein